MSAVKKAESKLCPIDTQQTLRGLRGLNNPAGKLTHLFYYQKEVLLPKH